MQILKEPRAEARARCPSARARILPFELAKAGEENLEPYHNIKILPPEGTAPTEKTPPIQVTGLHPRHTGFMLHVHLAGKGVESSNEVGKAVFVIKRDGVTVTLSLAPIMDWTKLKSSSIPPRDVVLDEERSSEQVRREIEATETQ